MGYSGWVSKVWRWVVHADMVSVWVLVRVSGSVRCGGGWSMGYSGWVSKVWRWVVHGLQWVGQ